MQRDELGAHRGAQLGVEVGERLVHEEHLGLLHHGARQGHALALAARELRRLAVQVLGEPHDARELVDAALALLLGHAGVLEAELDVAAHRHRGVERVVLEHHGNAAAAGVHVVHADAVHEQVAVRHALQPGDHAQRGGLAAAGRPHEHGEAAVRDREVHVLDDGDLVLVRLAHVAQLDVRHGVGSSFSCVRAPGAAARLPTSMGGVRHGSATRACGFGPGSVRSVQGAGAGACGSRGARRAVAARRAGARGGGEERKGRRGGSPGKCIGRKHAMAARRRNA